MHEGHRERMRKRILDNGIASLQPHEVLEYMLYYVVPRKDTNELAHELINTFGSFSAVLNADYEDLLAVKNMTENGAHFLSSAADISRYYMKVNTAEKVKLSTRTACVKYMKPFFAGENIEKAYLLCLDAQNNLINCVFLASGQPSKVGIDVRQVVDAALKNKAVAVILAHNHPSGSVQPSHDDIEVTNAAALALELLQIRLYDHFIFGGDTHFSFYDAGLVEIINNNVNRFLKEGIKY